MKIIKKEWHEFKKQYGLNNWILQIYLGDVLPLLNNKVYVAGGFLERIISGNHPRDIDVFFADEESGKAFMDSLVIMGVEKPRVDFVTPLKNNEKLLKQFQYHTIEEHFKLAEFTVTSFCFDGVYIYYTQEALEDLFNKKLVVNYIDVENTKQAFRFLKKRIQKYIEKGYLLNDTKSIDRLKQLVNENKRKRGIV